MAALQGRHPAKHQQSIIRGCAHTILICVLCYEIQFFHTAFDKLPCFVQDPLPPFRPELSSCICHATVRSSAQNTLVVWEDESYKASEHEKYPAVGSAAPEAWNGTECAGMVAAFCHTEVCCVWGSQPVSLDLRPERDGGLPNLHTRARPVSSS